MPSLKPPDLQKDIKAGIRPVYLVHGDEPFLIDECRDMIERAALAGAIPQFNQDVFLARESDAEDVVASCRTMPVMADRRVVLVKDVNAWKTSGQELLITYLEKPLATTCLIMTASERMDTRSKLLATAKTSGAVIEARHPYGRQLLAEINKMAKSLGKRLDQDAAELLLAVSGSDLASLKMQVEKLALYVGEGKAISREDVAEAVADVKLFTIFEFTDALGTKDLEAALRSFRTMLDLGEAPVKILAMVARHFRILFQLQEHQKSAVPLEESAKSFKLPPGILKNKYLPQTQRFPAKELSRIWKILANLDYTLKSRPSSREVRELIFEQMIIKLCGT
jgi:DNA polymerase-3 subunit delta